MPQRGAVPSVGGVAGGVSVPVGGTPGLLGSTTGGTWVVGTPGLLGSSTGAAWAEVRVGGVTGGVVGAGVVGAGVMGAAGAACATPRG